MAETKKKIVIGSGKGGVGKSMLSSGLSYLFGQENKIVALDCDVDAPNLAIWLNEAKEWEQEIPVATSFKPEIDREKCDNCGLCAQQCSFGALKMKDGTLTFNRFLCEGCGLCEAICPKKAITLKKVKNGLIRIKKTKYDFPLIAGKLLPGETGSGKIVSEIEKEAEKMDYQLMVIDSSPGTGCPVIAAFRMADFAVLVTEPTPSGIADLERILEVIDHFNIPWRLVINKYDINPKMTKTIEHTFGQDRLIGRISYDQAIFKAVSRFQPIMETNLKAKEEITNIFNNLKQYV
jgi:MinD superfamily P-loop ATPase